MKARLIAAIISVFSQFVVPIYAIATDAPQDFAYALPIEGIGDDALYRIVITAPVYAGVAYSDLRDVRIFNGDGEVVPHAFRPLVAEREQPAAVTLPFFTLRGTHGTRAADLDIALETNDGNVSLRVKTNGQQDEPSDVLGYLLDLSAQHEAFSALNLEWEPQPGGYIGTVDIEASDDLKNWSQLVRNAPLLSLSQGGQQLERKSVPLHNVRKKYLRLTWPEESNVIGLTHVSAQPVDKRAPLARASRQASALAEPRKRGDYIADFGGLFPVDTLTIRLPQDNSVAPIQIYSRNSPNDAWRRVSGTIAYRLRQDGQIIESPTLRVPLRAHRYWMFRVDQQGGGIGDGPIRVEAAWLAHEVIFTARGPGPFVLAFGNSRAQRNALPVETLVPNWGRDSAPTIALATTGSTETLAGPAAARQRIDAKKAGLWSALFVGVAVLGLMAWRISRQMNAGDE